MAKLIEAATELLKEWPYSELSLRAVAAHANVSVTTAYTYFPTKAALIAQVFLGMLRDVPVFVDVNKAAQQRVADQLTALTMLIADKTHLTDACLTALMSDDQAVGPIRDQIAIEINQRIAASLGPGYQPEVAATLHMLYSGALVHARSGAVTYTRIIDQLTAAAALILAASAPPSNEP